MLASTLTFELSWHWGLVCRPFIAADGTTVPHRRASGRHCGGNCSKRLHYGTGKTKKENVFCSCRNSHRYIGIGKWVFFRFRESGEQHLVVFDSLPLYTLCTRPSQRCKMLILASFNKRLSRRMLFCGLAIRIQKSSR